MERSAISQIPKHLMHDGVEDIKAKNAMGKDDFLKLLMAQIQSQDPLKPMDHQQFATQLAQFSTIEKLGNIEKGIDGLGARQSQDGRLQMLNMVGRHVEAMAEEIELEKGTPVNLRHALTPDLKPLVARIYDHSGNIVRTIDLSGASNKDKEIQWDGKDDQGGLVSSGEYTFRVLGMDKQGQAKEVGSEVSGEVIGVKLEADNPKLIVKTESGQKEVAVSKVTKIVQKTENTNGSKEKITQPIKPQIASSEISEDNEEDFGNFRGIPMMNGWER